MRRFKASRWVLLDGPVLPVLVFELPVRRPEASRYWVVVPDPPFVRVSAAPLIFPVEFR